MAQPPHSEIPVASAAPSPAAYGENYNQEKQYAAGTASPYGQQYPPSQGVPIAWKQCEEKYNFIENRLATLVRGLLGNVGLLSVFLKWAGNTEALHQSRRFQEISASLAKTFRTTPHTCLYTLWLMRYIFGIACNTDNGLYGERKHPQ